LRLLVRNLKQLATPVGREPRRGRAMRELLVSEDPAVLIEDGRFAWVGAGSDLPDDARHATEIDGAGGTLLPGFVDSHTHIAFAGSRESEFNRRLRGETYEDIARSGGGILSSVRATRAASEQELEDLVLSRTRTMAAHGTTTAEVKSGYGLEVGTELRQLRAIQRAARRSGPRLVATCLAAHDIPPEVRDGAISRESFLELVEEEIYPVVARERLAVFCDVFVERGVFTRGEGERLLRAGRERGLIPRLHADELSDTGGARLAASLDACSADHLMHISDDGIRALAAGSTVANLLPATSLFLMSERLAPARALIDEGAIVSLSTDCNPGSSMTESMQLVVQLASLRMKMTVEEVLTAATLHGAVSLRLAGETGSIEVGKRADFMILDAPSYLHLVYHFGVNLVRAVYRDGIAISGDERYSSMIS
jgi:imidazolonepropionase